MSIVKKIFIIICAVALVQAAIISVNPVQAVVDVSAAVDKIDNASSGAEGSGSKAIESIIGSIINIVRIAGVAIAFIILMVIATKYILASAGDRADIKKYAVNYVIGAMIFLGASGILTIIKTFIDANVTA